MLLCCALLVRCMVSGFCTFCKFDKRPPSAGGCEPLDLSRFSRLFVRF